MFKSIEYKLTIYLLLLIIAVATATYMFLENHIPNLIAASIVIIFCITRLYKHYRKFNQNMVFLLNALENSDYSFNFSETKVSRREKELNQVLNRIKDILSKAKESVIENEKFLSLIIESVPTGIVILDENNNVVLTNKAVVQLLGLHVFTHLNQLKVIDKSYPEVFKNLHAHETKQIKVYNDREEIQITLTQSKITLRKGELKIIALNSIGNELEAKEMEAWIRLIRVMTHEIMNSIAPITSLSETLLSSLQDKSIDDESTIEAISTINSTAKGLIPFVESYRKFTGIPKPIKKEVDIIPLITQIIQLESSILEDKNIEIKFIKVSTPSIVVDADINQIQQVIVNLVKNAIEALGDSKEKKIQIQAFYNNNNKPQINISNNGNPIPEDIAAHIFIPFFTTKENGTGIGLSVSRYIMRLHGGNLIHRNSDEWTVFSMIF